MGIFPGAVREAALGPDYQQLGKRHVDKIELNYCSFSTKGGDMMSKTMVARKNNGFMRGLIVCVFIFSLMVGCATTPKPLMPEEISKVKKLAIVTILRHKGLGLFDHTDAWHKFGMYPIVAGTIFSASMVDSLGGNPYRLDSQLKDYPIKEILEAKITQKLSEKYEILNSNDLCDALKQSKTDQKLVIEDYLDACKKLGADTLLEVNFSYGVAFYMGEKSSAAIITNISVYDVYANNLLMKKEFISDDYFKKNRIVPDFAANSAELYKKDMLEIVNGFTQIVALEFGLKVDEVFQLKNYFADTRSAVTLSCKKPYKLDQDCSIWWGAKRTIKINEKEIKVAGSTDGKIILLMDNKIATDNERLSSCFQLVKEKLLSNGVEILKVTKFIFARNKDYAYILALNNDGYSILKNYTVEKDEEKGEEKGQSSTD